MLSLTDTDKYGTGTTTHDPEDKVRLCITLSCGLSPKQMHLDL
jgi:hypothetical protein